MSDGVEMDIGTLNRANDEIFRNTIRTVEDIMARNMDGSWFLVLDRGGRFKQQVVFFRGFFGEVWKGSRYDLVMEDGSWRLSGGYPVRADATTPTENWPRFRGPYRSPEEILEQVPKEIEFQKREREG